MVRHRRASTASTASAAPSTEQELSSMYDYLAKIILLGPSGCGKSCLLHRFVKGEWRVLTSQTIGVEFASRIVKIGSGAQRKRIKFQLWDTAGTERFRSVSRSYYRGAAGAILVYDVCSNPSFRALHTFLHDARSLASPHLTLVLAGNKVDLANAPVEQLIDAPIPSSVTTTSSGDGTFYSINTTGSGSSRPASSSTTQTTNVGLGNRQTATIAPPHGREVSAEEASTWAADLGVQAVAEVSALNGAGVEELFTRLAKMILTRIELGEIDPDDPQSGIQYGDSYLSSSAVAAAASKKKKKGTNVSLGGWFSSGSRRGARESISSGAGTGMREWEEVFRLDSARGRRRGGCC